MFLHFSIQDVEQRELFFKLSNAFSLAEDFKSDKGKHSGLYAIFNGEIPVYVGYSENLASRIATHLRGKYSSCTSIFLISPYDHDFIDFYDRSKESRKEILMNNEKELMAALQPTENINIDMDFSLPENQSMGLKNNVYLDDDHSDYMKLTSLIGAELSSIVIINSIVNKEKALDIYDDNYLYSDSEPVLSRINFEIGTLHSKRGK